MIRLRALVENLDRFFFGFSAPASVAAFRIMFGVTLLLNVGLRMAHTEYYFSDLSGIKFEDISTMLPEFFRPIAYWAPATVQGAWTMQAVMVLALLLLIVGLFGRIGTRLLMIVIAYCHLGLLQRNYSIVYGADMITSFWLFGMCFLDSTERFSIHAWMKMRKATEPDWSRILTSVGVRILQIQLCVIYMYTGFEKLKGEDWWDQTAVWKVLGNQQLMLADLSFLKDAPLIIGLATWGTVLFEIYAPVLIWPRATRRWTILAGWALHIGIGLTMGFFIFSLTMMSAYLLFVDSNRLSDRVGRILKPRSVS